MITKAQVEDLCELNSEQLKAFKKLQRAYRDCLHKNIYFHQILDSLQAFNGNNVEMVDDTDVLQMDSRSPFCIQSILIPIMKITSSWADDDHFVHFKK